MHHRSRFTKALRSGENELGEVANRTTAHRSSASLLYPALFIAGSLAAGLVIARYLRTRSRSRPSATEPLATKDDFSEPVVVGGAGPTQSPGTMHRAEEWLPERTEYFAADTASAPSPAAFSTDNPDIPTLHPERDGVESQRTSEERQRTR